ncbi:MAG: metallophosphoesterase [Bacteroidales bacterium]|nr:metallophosphoesterase [Bacteroidales bacterium]
MKRRTSWLLSIMLSAAVMLLISSCATLSSSGVGRIKEYGIESARIPVDYDGCRVAFVSDIHYPSLFTPKRLKRLVAALEEMRPDFLLLGGDYVTHDDSIRSLFSALECVQPRYGTYAVLGNHERRNSPQIAQAMEMHGVVLLADSIARLGTDEEPLFIAGIRDSFSCDSAMLQRVNDLEDKGFVILLAHTPDYAERSSVNADVVLSGHTHGGQVSFFGLYTPVKNTQYGNRFLSGRNVSTVGTTVITTNGVGTSRKKVRFCAPSEVVLLTLKKVVR